MLDVLPFSLDFLSDKFEERRARGCQVKRYCCRSVTTVPVDGLSILLIVVVAEQSWFVQTCVIVCGSISRPPLAVDGECG